MIIRKGFFFLLLSLLSLIVLTLVFAGDPLFRSVLRDYGPTAIGQPMDFETASLSILKGQAQVSELRIGPESKPLLKTLSVLLHASASDLLAGRLYIEEASLTNVHLRLLIDENGHFEFDPGPPPAGSDKAGDNGEHGGADGADGDSKNGTPAEDRDLVQIVSELWERYQTYKEYYDEYGGVFGGGKNSEEEAAAQRIAWPGRPEYLDDVAKAEAAAGESGESPWFQLQKAEIASFSWETLDKRTGKEFLPPIKQGTLSLLNIGTPTDPSTLHANLDLQDGGRLLFSLEVPKDEAGLTSVSAEAKSVPVDAFKESVNRSLPYKLQGGELDLIADALRFNDQSLQGRVRVELRGASFAPGPKSKSVLGVKPAEFCKIINHALQSNPVAFEFTLGGTPTNPTFKIENATDLDDFIMDALKDEAKARLDAEVDKAKEKLDVEVDAQKQKIDAKVNEQQKKIDEKTDQAKDDAKDKLGDKAKDLLGDKKKDLGSLFGGKKKKKKDG